MAASGSLHQHLLRFVQAFMVQMGQTALANACHVIEQRLARWLLMCHDRVDGDDLSTTHEFLSLMLGVRRAGADRETFELATALRPARTKSNIYALCARSSLAIRRIRRIKPGSGPLRSRKLVP
jgi:hypothetical protein